MGRNFRGFTLVETIFSTLFISLTVLAIINLFPGAYLSVKRSETQLQADMLAKSIIEELRMTPFDQLNSGPYTKSGVPFDLKKVDGITYSPQVTIYDVSGTDPLIVRGVKVEISYRVGPSSKKEVHETYIHSLSR